MKQTLQAIYKNGVFKPLKPPQIPDGERVRLVVEAPSLSATDDLINLAAQVYEGLSDDEIDEVEQIALDRRNFFGENK